jgi:hypothetical protein
VNTNPESFWADILSTNHEKILSAIHSVSEEEKQAVIKHLQFMAYEDGWSEGQRNGARTALEVLQE